MLSLARYASVAYQATALLREAGERDAALRQSQSELKQRATELVGGTVREPQVPGQLPELRVDRRPQGA